VLALGIAGAALLFGDVTITPAISVLSEVEGISLVALHFKAFVLPVTVGILFALFLVWGYGTGAIAAAFGSITVI
jgi:KUP system potassium uptake protein